MHHAYQTALVTGASSGIGQRLAKLLAGDGRDLVIVARRTELLEALAARLREEHKVSVELLVNNAGFGSSGSFTDLPVGTAEDQIRLNVAAVVRLTHAALPGMLRRGHGGVLNVSSVAGFVPSPGAAVYGATKAFVTSFSESLSAEVQHRGVHVTALCPGFTRTEFRDGSSSGPGGLAWLDADRVARAGLDAVAAGRVLTVPGAQYKSVVSLTRMLPRGVLRSAAKAMRRP